MYFRKVALVLLALATPGCAFVAPFSGGAARYATIQLAADDSMALSEIRVEVCEL